jgi:hypothetical protein
MNSSLVFVLVLVSIVMCANVMKAYLQQKKRVPETNDELEDTLTKIEVLEDRIQVLERIITENRYDLKGEIDSL